MKGKALHKADLQSQKMKNIVVSEQSMTQAIIQAAEDTTKAAIMAVREVEINTTRPT